MVSDSDNAAVATVRDQGPASKRYDETFPVIAGSGSRTGESVFISSTAQTEGGHHSALKGDQAQTQN